VFRLPDSGAEVRPARPGLLRVCAHASRGLTGLTGLTGLRVMLVSDLITRAAELRRLQVLTVLASEGPVEIPLAAALGIHPPAARAAPADAEAALGGPIDVHLAGPGDDQHEGLVARVGAVEVAVEGGTDAPGDPLAVRLALLGVPWHRPAELTEAVLAEAAGTLKDWRRLVAEWARSPSRPVPPEVAGRLRAAFAGLDTVAVLALLRDQDLPPGARFETFAYADRVLGLELVREVGT
jgi:hypothetical protein